MPLTIAITGAAGHVGSGVCRSALDDGHNVVGLDISGTSKLPLQERYTYKSIDVVDFEAFKTAVEGCDAIIHLAATYTLRDKFGKVVRDVPQHVRCPGERS